MDLQDSPNARPIEDERDAFPPEVKAGWYVNPIFVLNEAQRQADMKVADYQAYQGSRS